MRRSIVSGKESALGAIGGKRGERKLVVSGKESLVLIKSLI